MYQISLFGTLTIARDDRALPLKLLPGARELLAYLLLNRTQPIARDRLAALLWPDMPENKGRAKLRRNLFDLRKALASVDESETWLQLDRASIQWQPTVACQLDVETFQRLHTVPSSFADAAALYRGDLLEELYADWIVVPRERLRLSYLELLEKLIQRLSARRAYAEALSVADTLLLLDPLSESTVQHLMRLRHMTGDRVGALRVYAEFEALLMDELGVEPLDETQTLHEQISADISNVLFEREDATGLPNNLRAAPNRFFGRNQELTLLHAHLTNPTGPRLITITGSGGCGKTRLARQLGQLLIDDGDTLYPAGIFFVELAAVTQPESVMEQLVQTLGLADRVKAPTPRAIASAIGQQKFLLILDNLEQVLTAAQLISDLLAFAPSLRMLITSRAPLRCYGEHEVRLQPLALPDNANVSVEDARAFHAIELFEERARAANPSFVISAENLPDVLAICHQLDGLPLALEIAAAGLRFRPIAALRKQLTTNSQSVRHRLADLPDRHESLFAVIDWGYQLLSAELQALFAAISVFPATFDARAAHAIFAPDADLFELEADLLSLVEHSLLQVVNDDETLRFRLLVTVRRFAQNVLGEPDALYRSQKAHLDYFGRFLHDAFKQLYKDDHNAALASIDTEIDNIRAALGFALQAPDPNLKPVVVRILVWLEAYWSSGAMHWEAHRWLQQICQHLPALSARDQVEMLTALGFAQNRVDGEKDVVYQTLEQALVLARGPDVDREWLTKTTNSFAIVARERGDFDKAHELMNEGLAHARSLYEQSPDDYHLRFLLNILNTKGTLSNRTQAFDEAVACFDEAMVLARQGGFRTAEASFMVNLSGAHRGLGALRKSAEYLHSAFAMAIEASDKTRMLVCLSNAAEWLAELDRHEAATVLHSALKAESDRVQWVWRAVYQAEFDSYIARAKAALSESQFDAAWEKGSAMQLDTASQYAVQLLEQESGG